MRLLIQERAEPVPPRLPSRPATARTTTRGGLDRVAPMGVRLGA